MTQIHGIVFDVQWDKFGVHSSFFIPCLDDRKARKLLYVECRERKLQVRIKTVTEDRIRGVRVWRLK
jgi:hypothetical protein